MWLIIFAVSILIGIAPLLYLAGKIRKTGIFSKIANRAAERIASVAAAAVCAAVIIIILDVTNAIVIIMHIAVFLLVGDLAALIYGKITGKRAGRFMDAAALSFCAVYLVIGWILMHGMWESSYELGTDKSVGHIRVAHIADSHVGCGFSGKGFGKRLQRIQEAAPDILVITGDFVDDSTSKADMTDACSALGDFDCRYGVFFCFGNHDRGYGNGRARGYDGDELVAELEKNGVTVLEDESVLVDGRFYLTGRADAGYGGSTRLPIAELVSGLDAGKYDIVLDHQPTDYDAEAAAGVDLVLSGHTHGGQLFPLEYIQPLISSNDNVRGHERRLNTDFIVTDGISDWAVKFRTGCRSEYNIIDIWEDRGS